MESNYGDNQMSTRTELTDEDGNKIQALIDNIFNSSNKRVLIAVIHEDYSTEFISNLSCLRCVVDYLVNQVKDITCATSSSIHEIDMCDGTKRNDEFLKYLQEINLSRFKEN